MTTLYEFHCSSCGGSDNVFRRREDRDNLHSCMTCHSTRTVRRFGAVSLGGRAEGATGQRVTSPHEDRSNVVMVDCVAENNGGAGLYVGPGVNVSSRRGRYVNNAGGGVVNEGVFNSHDDELA